MNIVEKQDIVASLKSRPIGLAIGVTVIVALFAVSAWWALSPSYAPLYKNATEASQADILANLDRAHIPYRINTKDNAIEVSEERLGEARMKLAESGIPTRAGSGFELFDHADYGMSEFTQKINYQRALEGELARTIMGMREIRQARVHLTLKRTGIYLTAPEQPKASVVIQLRPEAVLDGRQARGIQELIASAVEGMTIENVVVMNEAGQLLNSGDLAGQMPDRLQLVSRVENELRTKAESLLQHTLGVDNGYVAVNVQMNFDKIKAVRERPLPVAGSEDGLVLREKELHTSSSDATDSGQVSGGEGRTQDTSETEYVVGKEHSEIEYAAGKLERVNVGVVLSTPVDGVSTTQIQELLTTSLGLNPARGDRISILYAAARISAPVRETTVPVKVTPTTVTPSIPVAFWWIVAGGLIFSLALLAFITRLRQSAVTPDTTPNLSGEDREALLADLRRWLKEPQ